MTTRCERCGADISNGRCQNCGATVHGAEAGNPASTVPVVTPTFTPHPAPAPADVPPAGEGVTETLHPASTPRDSVDAKPTRQRLPVRTGLIVAGITIIAGVIAVQSGWHGSAPDNSGAPSGVSTASATPTIAPTTARTTRSAAQREADAAAELARQAASDRTRIVTNNQWVAQMSSKYVGVTDPLMTTSAGSHTFYAVDILAEHQETKQRLAGYDVALLDSRTYGKRSSHDGEPIWVTMVFSSSFTSEDAVNSWCGNQFPNRSAKDRTNLCMANRMRS